MWIIIAIIFDQITNMPILLVLRILYDVYLPETYTALLSLGLQKLILDRTVQGCEYVIGKLGRMLIEKITKYYYIFWKKTCSARS
ncbi:unnamed protein product [Callosobruchus maculatus]|uniref:Uncharacterized protein n=1 Tax=Callosobruchus maculatus TaxID=64391 RepID=A0A653D9V4_CALMS|nr:unnamed protein product [Callosobruchus maculatus]